MRWIGLERPVDDTVWVPEFPKCHICNEKITPGKLLLPWADERGGIHYAHFRCGLRNGLEAEGL